MDSTFLFIYRENIDLRLYRACRDGDQTVITLLLERGANPTKLFSDPLKPSSPRRDAYSCTSFHAASQNGHLKCLKFLFETKNFNPNILDSNRQTPLHHACENGHKSIVQYLLAHLKCIATVKNKNRNTPLHFASRNGHLECVKLLFEVCTSHFIDPNVRNKYRQTPMHYACFNGHGDIVKYLLTHATCKPNAKNGFGYTPLHLASRNGHLECVKSVIEETIINIEVDSKASSNNKQTALHLACENGHTVIAKYLINNAKCSSTIVDNISRTPLHVASSRGHIELVKLLMENSTVRDNPNVTDINQQTPLHLACMNGHENVVECLFPHTKCNPNFKDKSSNTPLHLASSNGHLECAKLIIESSTVSSIRDVFNKNLQTPLHLACMNGHKDIVPYLLNHAKCIPNFKDFEGNTPLHLASSNGHLECVKLIIESSTIIIDADVYNDNKQTALHLACENGHTDIAKYLINNAKCSPTIVDNISRTPLHVASSRGYLELVKLLMEITIICDNLNVTDINQQTPLHLACMNGHENVVECLFSHTKCDPNFKDLCYNTPLHVACRNGHLECVKLIIESNTVSSIPGVLDKNLQTALQLACMNGHKDIVAYLLTNTICIPNFKDFEGNTPLHLASSNGHLECVKLIIEFSTIIIDADVYNDNKQTALHLACENGHTDIAKYLINNAKCSPTIVDNISRTPLHVASSRGYLELVKLLMEITTVCDNLNVTDINQQTPLHLACIYGHENVVECLFPHTKCNPNFKDLCYNTALHLASSNGHLECVKLIIESSTIIIDADVYNVNKQTALHLACENGHTDIAKYLINNAKCSPTIVDNISRTPLHVASSRGYLELVKLLMEVTTVCDNLNVTDINQQTPLHLACNYGHENVVECLFPHTKCNPNFKDLCYNTALHLASSNGHLECVKLIIESSTIIIDADVYNVNKQTALHLACENGHTDIAKYLINNAKCSPTIVDNISRTPLHVASSRGYLELVKLLMEVTTVCDNLNVTDINKQTPLHLACMNGHENVVECLFSHTKCDPNFKDLCYNTPLHVACRNGHLKCVKLIIESNTVSSIPGVLDKNLQTALHLACMNGHKDIVAYLLTNTICIPNFKDFEGNTPLHLASSNGHLECVKLIIESSTIIIDADVYNDNKQTALHLACENGHTDIAKYLINNAKCSPTIVDNISRTPLHVASSRGYLELVKLLMEITTVCDNLNVTDINQQTPLHLACIYGHENVVECLFPHTKCNPNFKDLCYNTPLHVACRTGHLECVKLIIESSTVSSIPGVLNKYLQTALHLACKIGHKHIVNFLLTNTNCDPNFSDIAGNTPLHVASLNGHLECVKTIFKTGTVSIKPNVSNNHLQTPLLLACLWGHKDIVKYLLTQFKCDPNVRDSNGDTPLHVASFEGHLECVKSIAETKTDFSYSPNVCNYHQQTPLHLACVWGHENIVKYLLTCAKCTPNIQDNHGNTPLYIASRNGHLECVRQIIEWSTDNAYPDFRNSKKEAFFVAFDNEHEEVAKYLLSPVECHFNSYIKNEFGDTILCIASRKGNLDIVKFIIENSTVRDNPNVTDINQQTPACINGHENVVECLFPHTKCNPNFKDLCYNTALHLASSNGHLECVKLIIESSTVKIDPDVHNEKKQTALHLACVNGHKNIFDYLLTKCDPNSKDIDGNTPLHVACQRQKDPLLYVQVLVSIERVNPDEANDCKQTALHLACRQFHTETVEFLLTNTECDPNLRDIDGYTPLRYGAGNSEIVRQLIRHGADPQIVYKEYSKVLGKHAKRPPKSRTKVVITGDSGTGKTTLVEALKKEKSFLVRKLTPTDVVTEVETKTAGIIPHEFESREYGKVTFYDLAGHREYYDSHSAVLKSLTGANFPVVLLVTDVSKCDGDIGYSVTYWMNFLENQFPVTATPVDPQNKTGKLLVLVVGSHLDLVSNSSITEKTTLVKQIINSFDGIEYAGFIPMDCRLCESSDMSKLRRSLKECSQRLQTQDSIHFNAHCFHVYVFDEYRDVKVVPFKVIQAVIREDENEISSILPESTYRLCRVCEDLSERGTILFLKDITNLQNSWIVLDTAAILSEIHGTVFAPKDLTEYADLASSTGVVPVSKLKETFPHYDTRMLVGVLQCFEFCHDVCDQLVKLIHKQNERDLTCMEQADAPTFKKEHHLFFPSLVRVEAPNDLWEPNPQNQVHFGWIIQCTRPHEHFLPRFQSVLCNRLAFKFALAPDPEEIDPTIPALQRKCSVWKNGIYWGTRQGMETLVEMDTHCKSVVLLMQCRQTSADFRKLRFEVIQRILKCAEEFCPKIKTAVSLITRKDISYPLKPVSELTSISLPEVKTAVRENSDSAVSKDGKPTPLEYLIGTGTKIEVSWLLPYTLCIAILYVFIIVNVTYW